MKILKWAGIIMMVLIVFGVIGTLTGEPIDSTGVPTTSHTERTGEEISFPSNNESTRQGKVEEEGVMRFGKLEVFDLDSKSDDFASYIVGKVKNHSNQNYSYVQVEFNLYDNNGNQVGSTIDNIMNLRAGGTWSFEAMIFEDSVTRYELVDVTAW